MTMLVSHNTIMNCDNPINGTNRNSFNMEYLLEEQVNVYLPDSYLKGVISFSETNALGSCILGKPYIKADHTASVAIKNPVIEHVRIKGIFNDLKIPASYTCIEPLMIQNELYRTFSGARRRKLKGWLDRSKDISRIKINMLSEWLNLKVNYPDKHILDCIHSENLPDWLEQWFDSWLVLHDVITAYRKAEVCQTGIITKHNLGSIFIAVSSFGCIIVSRKSKRYCFCTYNQMLTWKDVALSRFNANFCVWISNCLNNLQDGLGLRSRLIGSMLSKLYNNVDLYLSTLGNEGYSIVKEFEGYLMSEILRVTEHAQFSLRFRNTLLNGLTDKLTSLKKQYMTRVQGTVLEGYKYPDYECNVVQLANILRTITLLVDKNITNAAELYFIFRIFGHPMVEEREAMDSVRINNEVTKFLDLKSLAEMRGAFILRVIKGFVVNYKRWPKVKNPKTLSRRWQMYLHAKTYPSNLELCVDDFYELAGIQFLQEFSIPETTNLEMVLNDKAISPPKQLIWSVYPKNYLPDNIQEEFKRVSNAMKDHEKTRRVLEYYLKDSSFNQTMLKKYVINQNYINDKEHVVSLTGKERELSVGRMFAMQPGKQRQIQILAEKMLAENLVPFFPETLTKYGDLELQRIMEIKSELSSVKMRKSDSYNNYIARASIVTDLSKFNQAFRYETTAVCADVADELHGTQSLFCWLHLTVPLTTMICTYRHAPPDTKGIYDIDKIPEQSGLYRYHMGGIEGWCQKMWTMEAISLLDVVSVKNRVQLTSLLNGDNQSIDVSKPVRLKKGVSELQADYSLAVKMLKEIRDAYHSIGHKLKEGETYISRDLQFMSKTIQSDGVMHPAAIKKVLRVGPWINTILDDIKTSMEAIGSLCQELEFRGESVVTSLVLRNFWLYVQCFVCASNHCLAGRQLSSELNKTLKTLKKFFEITKDKSTVDFFMNIPMQLGGGDPVVMYRSFYRRTPDFLTEVITHMDYLLRVSGVSTLVYDRFYTVLLSIDKNEKATLTTLMRDPQAIGSERQAKVTSEINRAAVTSVLSVSPNQLFSDSANHYNQNEVEIGTVASNIHPLYPHGLRVLYEAFPFYRAEKVVNMISGTKSITNILQRTSAISGLDIDRAVNMMIMNLGLFHRILSSSPRTVNLPKDKTGKVFCCQLSKMMRELSWGGLEIVGVSSPSILSSMMIHYVTASRQDGIVIEKFTSDKTTRGMRGPKMPWVGSSTQEKKLTAVYNRQALSRDQKEQLETLGKLRWVYHGVTGLRRVLDLICRGTLGLPYKLVKPLLPRFMSVNFLHRLAVSSRPMEFPASVPAYRTTNFHFDTSPINKRLSERFGNEDINLVFQNAISCGISIMCVVEQLTGRSPRMVVMEPIVEDIDIMPPPNFQGHFDHKFVSKIVSDQHIFNPGKISLQLLSQLLLPTVPSNNINKKLNTVSFFNGQNIIETLSACLACHWGTVLTLLTTENSIFHKEWGDGFVTDHAFIDVQVFLCAFKTYVTCLWESDHNSDSSETKEDPVDRLMRVDNNFWRMMAKVMLEQKVKKRIMLHDVHILNVMGSASFKNWFVDSVRQASMTEVPWIVNAEGDLINMKAIVRYITLMGGAGNIRSIMLSYSDMAHAMTRLLRCKNMQDNVPMLAKTTSPTDVNPIVDPCRTLSQFPKAVFTKLSTYNDCVTYGRKNTISTSMRNYITVLPWHHVNRFNFVYSSTGCKVSLKSCLGKLITKLKLAIVYFVGEGAGSLMARTACEYPHFKFVYRSLKDVNDHHHPTEYIRVIGNTNRIIDHGVGLSLDATDATKKEHWSHLHRHCKEPLLLTVCDAELPVVADVMLVITQWRRHVLSCAICTSYGTDMYLFIKYHAQEKNVILPRFVRMLAAYSMQGSKLAGSEIYVLVGLGHQNSLPCYGEVRISKMMMAHSLNFQAPLRPHHRSVEVNLKSLIPGAKLPLNHTTLCNYVHCLQNTKDCKLTNATIGGCRVVETKWVTCKINNIAKWLTHVLKMPKGELNYNFFEVIEHTYPDMIDLLNSVNTTELKRLIKVTGYILSTK
nr:RNA-dependent RNA polymerase [Avian metapneumovirus]